MPVPTEPKAPKLWITRGGPTSGHYGHEGRPGQVGESLPSEAAVVDAVRSFLWIRRHGTHVGHEGRPGEIGGSQAGYTHVLGSIGLSGIKYFVRTGDYGSDYQPVASLEEATAGKDFWAYAPALQFSVLLAVQNSLRDSPDFAHVDVATELQHAFGVYRHVLGLLADPSLENVWKKMDPDGEWMVMRARQWVERLKNEPPTNPLTRHADTDDANIVLTNAQESVGAGSATTGQKGVKVFWEPVTMPTDRSVLENEVSFVFGLSPVAVLVHELGHRWGRGSELDSWSEVVAADYYLNHGDLLSPNLEKEMVSTLSALTSRGLGPARGKFERYVVQDRAGMGWLYSRHREYFDSLLMGAPEGHAGQRWYADPVKSLERMNQWAKEATKPIPALE